MAPLLPRPPHHPLPCCLPFSTQTLTPVPLPPPPPDAAPEAAAAPHRARDRRLLCLSRRRRQRRARVPQRCCGDCRQPGSQPPPSPARQHPSFVDTVLENLLRDASTPGRLHAEEPPSRDAEDLAKLRAMGLVSGDAVKEKVLAVEFSIDPKSQQKGSPMCLL